VIDSNALVSGTGAIGYNAGSSNNSVRVVNGATWQGSSPVYVGYLGSSNSLIIAGGTLLCNGVTVGFGASAGCDNLLEIGRRHLISTNRSASSVLEVRRGKLIFNGGLLQVDKLVITNACSQFVHNGGTLIIGTLVLATKPERRRRRHSERVEAAIWLRSVGSHCRQ